MSGPLIMQACATSVACVHAAAAGGAGTTLVVLTDRTSNGPHIVYPSAGAPGGTPQSENWVMDNFGCDPNTGEGMLATAERVAAQGGFSKEQVDAVTARRWEQYEEVARRLPEALDGPDHGRLQAQADRDRRRLGHPPRAAGDAVGPARRERGRRDVLRLADPSRRRLRRPDRHRRARRGPSARILASGFARVARGEMPKAPVPAAAAALADAGLAIADIDVIKTHNPFAVNDLWFARETGADLDAMNPFGCSLIYGHPQGPTGARGLVELMWALHDRGGGRGLFTGCAAGDTGAALVVEVV